MPHCDRLGTCLTGFSAWARCLAVAACALTLAACGTTAPAAGLPEPHPAEVVVEAYLETVEASDWRAAAELMDPAELDEMRELVQLMLSVSGPPLGVGAPPNDGPGVFAWFMDYILGASPMVAEALTEASGEILGTVVETDSLAHVVMRTQTRVMGIEVEKLGTTTVRRTDAGWAVAMNGDLRTFIDTMRWMGEDPDRFELDPDLEDAPVDKLPRKPGRDG